MSRRYYKKVDSEAGQRRRRVARDVILAERGQTKPGNLQDRIVELERANTMAEDTETNPV